MVKEWLTVWLFITIAAVGLVTVAVFMPFYAVHKMIVALQDWWLYRNKQEET